MDGPTLADRLAKGPLRVDEALVAARHIAEALEAAHEKGIVHRDLKPANIKLSLDGSVKVLDFGLAKVAAGDAELDLTRAPTIDQTREGAIVGPVSYMSPEQASGKPADKRSDLWAFGVVLFEMLTGRSVFAGETNHAGAEMGKRSSIWTRRGCSWPCRSARVRHLPAARHNRSSACARGRLSNTDVFSYDVMKDGSRFIVNRCVKPSSVPPLDILLNATALPPQGLQAR